MLMSRRAGGVLSIDSQARDESGLDRLLDSHRFLFLAVLAAILSALSYWAQGTIAAFGGLWVWFAVASFVLLLFSFFLDPLVAVWSRWGVVAADAGLRRARGGVPARWVAYPTGWRSVGLVVSPDTISAEEWKQAAPALAQGFGFARVSVAHSRRRVVLKFTNRTAATDGDYRAPVELKGQAVKVGIAETGKPFWLDTAGHSGVVVAGLPGSGKTVFLRRLARSFALELTNQVVIFDGKGTDDFDDLSAQNVAVFSGTPDITEDIPRELEELSQQLQQRAATGAGIGRVVVIVDECQGYMPSAGLTRDEKEKRERATKILKDLVARGRSLGFLTVLATQKPDANTLPTVLRDNCGLRACGRLRTSEGEKMVLGDSPGLVQSLGIGQMIFDDSKERTLVKVAREAEPVRGY